MSCGGNIASRVTHMSTCELWILSNRPHETAMVQHGFGCSFVSPNLEESGCVFREILVGKACIHHKCILFQPH